MSSKPDHPRTKPYYRPAQARDRLAEGAASGVVSFDPITASPPVGPGTPEILMLSRLIQIKAVAIDRVDGQPPDQKI